jgi:hypothetical protein
LYNTSLARSEKKKEAGLKLNWIHQYLVYADDVNLLGGNIDTMKKNTYALIDASKEVSLTVNMKKTEYALIFLFQNVGQDQNVQIGNRSFNIVAKLRYLRTAVTNRNLIHEEIKRRLYLNNAWYN